MSSNARGIAVMAEIVGVLARHTNLRVMPQVDEDRGVVALTVRVRADGEDGLQVVSLLHDLQHVANVANMRQLCVDLNIDAAQLQAMIPVLQDDAPPLAARHITVQEIDAVLRVLQEVDMPLGADWPLIESAVPKLVSLARAMGGGL